MSTQNPFSRPDPWQEIYEHDARYLTFKKELRRKTKFAYNPARGSWFHRLRKFGTFFTQTSTLVVLGAILFTGTLSQVYAAPEYKPSNLVRNTFFSANRQMDPEPEVALVEDENNALTHFEKCGFLFKHPRTYRDDQYVYEYDLSIYPDTKGERISYGSRYGVLVQCSPTYRPDPQFNFEPTSIEKLRSTYGWFILGIDSLQDLRIAQTDFALAVEFKYSEQYYRLIFPSKVYNSFAGNNQDNVERMEILPNEYQIQFTGQIDLPEDFTNSGDCRPNFKFTYNKDVTTWVNKQESAYVHGFNWEKPDRQWEGGIGYLWDYVQFSCTSDDSLYTKRIKADSQKISPEEIPFVGAKFQAQIDPESVRDYNQHVDFSTRYFYFKDYAGNSYEISFSTWPELIDENIGFKVELSDYYPLTGQNGRE